MRCVCVDACPSTGGGGQGEGREGRAGSGGGAPIGCATTPALASHPVPAPSPCTKDAPRAPRQEASLELARADDAKQKAFDSAAFFAEAAKPPAQVRDRRPNCAGPNASPRPLDDGCSLPWSEGPTDGPTDGPPDGAEVRGARAEDHQELHHRAGWPRPGGAPQEAYRGDRRAEALRGPATDRRPLASRGAPSLLSAHDGVPRRVA